MAATKTELMTGIRAALEAEGRASDHFEDEASDLDPVCDGLVTYLNANYTGAGVPLTDGDKGDITVASSGTVWSVDNNAITLAKLLDIATASFLGRTTASTGDPEVLTATQATALLNVVGALKGLMSAADKTKLDGVATGATKTNIGTASLDFGAFPGKSDASVDVTGQTSIASDSIVQCWLYPAATADHTAGEHLVETLKVIPGNIVVGTGFTIYGVNTSQINEVLTAPGFANFRSTATSAFGAFAPSVGGTGTRVYGTWTVKWSWV